MSKISRFGVSLEKDLLDKFDTLIEKKDYTNRSEAFRDLIRQELVKKQWQSGQKVAGIITLVYDHHKRELLNKLTDIQHDYHHIIISTQHIHLDHNNCLEIVVVKGRPKDIEKLSNKIRATKCVKHTELAMATTGEDLT